jgi:hypothetical protein
LVRAGALHDWIKAVSTPARLLSIRSENATKTYPAAEGGNVRSEAVSKQQLQRVPLARTIARLMTIKRDCMTKADAVVVGVWDILEGAGEK